MSMTTRGSRRRLNYGTSKQSSSTKCALCKVNHRHMSQVQTWQNTKACELVTKIGIALNDMVCRPCRDNVRRVLADPSHSPRWKKTNELIKCCVKSCPDVCFVHSKVADADTMKCIFDNESLHTDGDVIPVPTPLCKHHYYTVYSLVQPQQTNCPTCGISLKHVNARPCPNAELIRDHLSNSAGFEGTLSTGDKVCYSCYKSHLIILQEGKTFSKDSDLQSTLDEYRFKICAANTPSTLQQACELAMDKTIVHVGEELLQRKAVLLPAVHDFFLDELSPDVNLQEEERKTPSSLWVLSNLTSALQQHLVYSCKARKYGTLLYRPNTDLVPLLQQSLARLRQHEKKGIHIQFPPTKQLTSQAIGIEDALDDLNAKILDQCRTNLDRDSSFVEEYSTLDIDKEIEGMNPALWKAICMLTRSASERRGVSNKQTNTLSNEKHKKKVRRFFLLCSIMFCADDRCSMPMHTLVTDLVDSQGGTTFLIQALNKLGVCSSQDTLKRFIQSKVDTKEGKHPCSTFFGSSSFTVISADNIDYMHSYARVHKGTQNSSWHGTTVQLVQPLPSICPIQKQGSLIDGIANMELSSPKEPAQKEHSLSSGNTGTSSNALTSQGSPQPHQSSSRKRIERSSPFPSPLKLTRSPAAKAQRRARTGTECKTETDHQPKPPLVQIQHTEHTKALGCTSLNDFLINETENESLQDLQYELFNYMLQKSAVASSNSEHPFINIQDYFDLTRATHTERSQVAYLEVMDAVSDSKDTLLELVHDLYSKLIKDQNREYLVIEGDQKLYEVLQSLKFEYGEALDWVIPIPGDWHMLMNYQSAIMKPYFDAGLKTLAKAAGYPVASIQTCGQFKRTHHFLLEVWEALYRVMISMFLKQFESPITEDPLQVISREIMANKTKFNPDTLTNVISETEGLLKRNFDGFKAFIQELAQSDSTWRFWVQFVFQDVAAYIGLFLAIRSGDWYLRTACVKQMAPVFTAFDHTNYRKLISRHLADLLRMPQSVLTMFQQGAFVVSITGRTWHSVAIDEAHEMLINKACKMSIVRPSPDYVNRIARYLPYRTKALENLSSLLFPEEKNLHAKVSSPLTSKPDDIKREHNIICQVESINNSVLLQRATVDRGLINPFTEKAATTQQSYDLLNFRDIGQREFLNHIAFYILKEPSTSAPIRKRRLQTFSSKKVNKQRVSQLEKDRNLILSCMRKKIKWSLRTGIPIEKAGEQLIALPLAISDHQGNPNKGQKSYMTKAIANRYKKCPQPIILNEYPQGWRPQCCLMEGMFMINTSPLGSHTTYGDYARFLLKRHITPHFSRGCTEVHLLFDNQGQLKNTPKFFEHKRRDESATIAAGHMCDDINETTRLPSKWRENILHCRKCKRTLVCFLAQFMLKHINSHFSSHHKFYVAGAFAEHLANTSWFVEGSNSPQPDPVYSCNAEETDTMLWLHAKRTQCDKVLVLSPDTDVYMIGLPLQCTLDKDIIVQISDLNSRELRLLCMRRLITALSSDPDLATVERSTLSRVLQALFVLSGCDYISFFSGIGKATFLRYFFQHAEFISGDSQFTQGSLSDTLLENDVYKKGFLAFLRLIGTVYFKKHATAFESNSPESHFKSFDTSSLDVEQQHTNWLEDIRQNVWDRITFESEMIPSTEALWRHWQRSCWVIDMWRQADRNTMQVANINSYGWKVVDDTLAIDWDSAENQAAVNERVLLLTKGCKCKTGCTTGRCGCMKKGQSCSEGCSCLHCSNLPHITGEQTQPLQETAEIENQEQTPKSDSEDEMQSFLETFLASQSDLESCSESEAGSETNTDDEMLSD